jgi:hypothetical protein
MHGIFGTLPSGEPAWKVSLDRRAGMWSARIESISRSHLQPRRPTPQTQSLAFSHHTLLPRVPAQPNDPPVNQDMRRAMVGNGFNVQLSDSIDLNRDVSDFR